jgi:hypothetical protein
MLYFIALSPSSQILNLPSSQILNWCLGSFVELNIKLVFGIPYLWDKRSSLGNDLTAKVYGGVHIIVYQIGVLVPLFVGQEIPFSQ